MRVAALGTGPVFDRVVPALARSGFDVVAALDCDPAADSGRNGRPEPIRFVRSLDELASHTWDLCLVCDYQRLLPADFVRAGTVVNCHGGLLPRYRGVHGNGWAFINGETEIGYTVHRVDSTLDGGPIIFQRRFPITPEATFSGLKSQLVEDLVETLPRVLRALVRGALIELPQDLRDATFVGRRYMRDCYIEWGRSSEQIERFVRALSPPAAPGAFTVFQDKKLVILSAELFSTVPYEEISGHVVYRLEDRGVLVKTGDGVLLVKDVEYEGRRLHALDLFPRPGYRLGIDLIDEKLRSLGIV
ncbi:methionyl-tRNA formyltransferase [Candidatus Solirubrobacter pratensis]|uniref:methionyl-tRNA formyltransferase n=1 Tax=Candidatus Solirubrobacter pratensis TaxID=1298857 RepID=UPI0004225B10|nr:formyltransferase family protein [Candidatus Solirubrobacter pratensis]